LSGIEMGLRLAGVPHREGGVLAALQTLIPAGPSREPLAGVR
jgi:hypothetical protein